MSTTRLERRLASFEAIRDIVTSLRALSALQLRQAGAALEAIRGYELELRRALAALDTRALEPRAPGPMLTLVFGSDQGLCGPLNRRVAEEATRLPTAKYVPIGSRLLSLLEPEACVDPRPAAESLHGVDPLIAGLAEDVERRVASGAAESVQAVHPIHRGGGGYSVGVTRIFPLDRTRLGVSAERTTLHLFEPEPRLAEHLLLEWMHTALYWVALETLASIHGARLSTTDGATHTIDRRLVHLRQEQNRVRQGEITTEVQEAFATTLL